MLNELRAVEEKEHSERLHAHNQQWMQGVQRKLGGPPPP